MRGTRANGRVIWPALRVFGTAVALARANRMQPTCRLSLESSRADLPAEQTVDLHDEPPVLQRLQSPRRFGGSSLEKHYEKLTARLILPAEPEVRRERVRAAVVLYECRGEHARRHRVHRTSTDDGCMELALRQVDPVERDRW